MKLAAFASKISPTLAKPSIPIKIKFAAYGGPRGVAVVPPKEEQVLPEYLKGGEKDPSVLREYKEIIEICRNIGSKISAKTISVFSPIRFLY